MVRNTGKRECRREVIKYIFDEPWFRSFASVFGLQASQPSDYTDISPVF